MNGQKIDQIINALRHNPDELVGWWIGVGVVLFVFSQLTFYAPLKRLVLALWHMLAASLFMGVLVFVLAAPALMVLVALPFITLIAYMNVSCTHVCDHCCRAIYRKPFTRIARPGALCRCGEPLP